MHNIKPDLEIRTCLQSIKSANILYLIIMFLHMFDSRKKNTLKQQIGAQQQRWTGKQIITIEMKHNLTVIEIKLAKLRTNLQLHIPMPQNALVLRLNILKDFEFIY